MFTNVISNHFPASYRDYYFIHSARKYLGVDFVHVGCYTDDGRFCFSFYVVPGSGGLYDKLSDVIAWVDYMNAQKEVCHD